MAIIPAPIVAATGRVAAAGFGAVAGLRHGRAVHTPGCAYGITVEIRPEFEAFWGGRTGTGIVRISKGGGFPDPLPDILGVAVRLDLDGRSGRPVDLLGASSSAPQGLRHLLVPARRFDRAFFSSLTPYDTPTGLRLYGFHVTSDVRPLTLDDARRGAAQPVRIGIEVATLSGPWRPAATLVVVAKLPGGEGEELRFNPWNATEPFRPVGAFNRVRDAAYLASQRARRADPRGPQDHVPRVKVGTPTFKSA